MHTEIGCIGTGNIVEALLSGVEAGREGYAPSQVGVYSVTGNEAKLAAYRARGYAIYGSISELVRDSHVVLIAVRPQAINSILPDLKASCSAQNVFVSVLPGVTTAWYEANVAPDVKTVQCTPTLTAQVGMGAHVIDASVNLTADDYAAARRFLESSGIVEDIPADLMDAVTPIAGCAPAYFYHMADVVVREAQALGLDADASLRLFAQTMKGSAQMLLDAAASGEETPKDLEAKLLLPEAATLKAIEKMVELGFDDAIVQGIRAAVAQCKVLGQQG